MPRTPRRPPDGPDPDTASTKDPVHGRAERRAWLSRFKEDAVQQLPPSASPAARARLRADLDHALRHHGLTDSPAEVQDIVATLVAESRRQLDELEEQARRSESKPQRVLMAKLSLIAALNQCPAHLVGAPGSDKRTQTTQAAWATLRPALDKTLSGGESPDDVHHLVEEHVARWRSEHDHWWRPRAPSPATVIRNITTAKAIVDAVNQTPELRQLAGTIAQAARILWRQRRPPGPPPEAGS